MVTINIFDVAHDEPRFRYTSTHVPRQGDLIDLRAPLGEAFYVEKVTWFPHWQELTVNLTVRSIELS